MTASISLGGDPTTASARGADESSAAPAPVTVVDVGLGNVASVAAALRRAGAEPRPTRSPADVDAAPALVLPGVGAFGHGMGLLREAGLVEPIRRHVLERGRPLLGICLGMQLLADRGEEHGHHEGLGIVPGAVVRLPEGPGLRVPNIGWCDVSSREPARVPGMPFYFVHSFHLVARDAADVLATFDRGGPVTAAVARGPALGVQFHPEKSHDAGLDLLGAWIGSLRPSRTRPLPAAARPRRGPA
jgi:glutamine amidotransferase